MAVQGAWYAEFVFLYYRIAMTASSVLLSSSVNTRVCLSLMALATAAALAFVLVVKPFADGDQGFATRSTDEMTRADTTQALSLGATLVAIAIGFMCLLIPDRSKTVDGVTASVIAVVAVWHCVSAGVPRA